MSSSDYDADLLKSSGAGMMRKIVSKVLKYTVSLKSCASMPPSMVLPKSSRTAKTSRPAPPQTLRSICH